MVLALTAATIPTGGRDFGMLIFASSATIVAGCIIGQQIAKLFRRRDPQASGTNAGWFRFRIGDLLLWMLLFGAAFTLISWILKDVNRYQFREARNAALTYAAAVLTIALVACVSRWWVRWLLLPLALLAYLFMSFGATRLFDFDWIPYRSDSAPCPMIMLVVYFIQSLLLYMALRCWFGWRRNSASASTASSQPPPATPSGGQASLASPRRWKVAFPLLCALVVLLAIPTAWIYIALILPLGHPPPSPAGANAVELVYEAVGRFGRFEYPEADFPLTDVLLEKQAEDFVLLDAALIQPSWLEPEYPTRNEVNYASPSNFGAQNPSIALNRKSAVHKRRLQMDAAIDAPLTLLRLSCVPRRNGLALDYMEGLLLEGRSLDSLRGMRTALSQRQRQRVTRALEEADRIEDDPRLADARTAFWKTRYYGWKARLEQAARRLAGGPAVMPWRDYWRFASARRRVLLLELVIASFIHDHGRPPQTLEELAPNYLTAVPLDPFVDRPFIYRVTDGKHTLYSVGGNGLDEGGVIAEQPWFADRGDYSLAYEEKFDLRSEEAENGE